jgi:hypothetical protein
MVLAVVGGGSGQIVPLILYSVQCTQCTVYTVYSVHSVQYIPWSWLWCEVAVDHRLAAPLTPPRPLATPSPPLSATPPPPPPAVGEKTRHKWYAKKRKLPLCRFSVRARICLQFSTFITVTKLNCCYEAQLLRRK